MREQKIISKDMNYLMKHCVYLFIFLPLLESHNKCTANVAVTLLFIEIETLYAMQCCYLVL